MIQEHVDDSKSKGKWVNKSDDMRFILGRKKNALEVTVKCPLNNAWMKT